MHITPDTIPTSATEARIILMLEEQAAEDEYWEAVYESERRAEAAIERHLERYDRLVDETDRDCYYDLDRYYR
jgi:hypothetical protein